MLVAEYKIIPKSGNVKKLYDAMLDGKIEDLILDGGVTKEYVVKYLTSKRDSVCEYTVTIENEEPVVLEFVAESRDDVKFLLEMFETKDVDELPVNPIPIEFIKGYLEGNRDSLLSLKLGKMDKDEKLEEE